MCSASCGRGGVGGVSVVCVMVMFGFLLTPLQAADNTNTDDAILSKWLEEFQPSTLTQDQQRAEITWFRNKAKDLGLVGITVRSTAEVLAVHDYEQNTLATAFTELTGIQVEHKQLDEGNLVPTIMEQLRTNRRYLDIYVHDADSIGTHLRNGRLWVICDKQKNMNPELANFTNPGLDLSDWMNLEYGQDYDGNLLQLPDQQFANLYFYRFDWFSDDNVKRVFQQVYKYPLGVPKTWKSYEDIAQFFTTYCRFPDGFNTIPLCYNSTSLFPAGFDSKWRVYGHMDYGALTTLPLAPSLAWRYSDAWFSMAGMGDQGLPSGGRGEFPQSGVDDFGVRADADGTPRGATVARGGEIDGYSAIYALNKSIDWLVKYAPSDAVNWEWLEAGPKASRGDIAQQMFTYITWLSGQTFKLYSFVVDKDTRKPLWRVAPSPRGRYWDEGMKIGYQDAGSWSIPKSTKGKQLQAAWLWAQFAVSKTVDLKKFLQGGAPVRNSTIWAQYLTDRIDSWGGLVEFYRSKVEKQWTDTGVNVPNYFALASLWAPRIGNAIKRAKYGESEGSTVEESLSGLGSDMDAAMSRMNYKKFAPNLKGTPEGADYWYNKSCFRPSDNTSLTARYCAPKPYRGEDEDYQHTVQLTKGEVYNDFFNRYFRCTLDANNQMTADCYA